MKKKEKGLLNGGSIQSGRLFRLSFIKMVCSTVCLYVDRNDPVERESLREESYQEPEHK